MNTLFAVDDGLVNANYNWADIFFIAGAVLGVLAAVIHGVSVPASTDPAGHPVYRYHHHAFTLLALAVGCVAFALFLL